MELHHIDKNGLPRQINIIRQKGLTVTDEDATDISASVYGATEAAVINNLRTRITELEAVLVAAGLLEE